MNENAWRYAFASVIGTSHTKASLPCQDASDCRVVGTDDGSSVLVAVVSDGAGSAKRAEVGAHLVCSLFIDEMETFLGGGGKISSVNKDFMSLWLKRLYNEVTRRAEAEELRPRDFASTLLAAVVGSAESVFVQVGDGAIVVSAGDDPNNYSWVFWPQKGEYENLTYFATEELALQNLEIDYVGHTISEVAIFTDGLQRLTLDFQLQQAHSPFFRSMFAPLRKIAAPNHSSRLSTSLIEYLSSPRVNDRVDDDKTLLLATRYEIPSINLAVTENLGDAE